VTDPLDELLAAARWSAPAQVRPPGVAAVRRIVRRRRIGTVVAFSVALVSIVATVLVIAH
jgi:hypothetical protein